MKATVIVAGIDIGKESCRVEGVGQTGFGCRPPLFRAWIRARKPRDKIADYLQREGFDVSFKGIAALQRKLASIILT